MVRGGSRVSLGCGDLERRIRRTATKMKKTSKIKTMLMWLGGLLDCLRRVKLWIWHFLCIGVFQLRVFGLLEKQKQSKKSYFKALEIHICNEKTIPFYNSTSFRRR